MKKVKRFLALGLTCAVVMGTMVGCGSKAPAEAPAEAPAAAEAAEEKAEGTDAADIKIGVSMATLQEERWQKDRDIVIQQLVDLGIAKDNILVQSADGDEDKQVTQCENLITQGINALLVFPQNGDACAPIVSSAHEAGVPVVAVDRMVGNSDLDFFVTYDAFYIGTNQGKYITEKCVDEGKWIMIAGSPTDPNAALIRQGQMEYVQPLIDAGKVEVVLDQAAKGWNPDDALLYTEQGLTANNNDIQCVFTSNDGCAGAAIEALKEQGLAGKVPVPGLDADLAACQRIVEGTQTMTVYRKLAVQDQIAAQAGYALATGKELSEVITTEEIKSKNNGKIDVPAVLLMNEDQMFPVDKDNMEEVVKDGWLTAAEIYANVPESEWPEWTANY